MKNFLITLLVFAALNGTAEASKAKNLSLQNARFLRNSQTIFSNPAHINFLDQYVTAEFGDTGSESDPKAEGGLFMRRSSSRIGAYFGHIDPVIKRLRENEAYFQQANPVELFWGSGHWGASASYSYSKNDSTNKGDRTAGFKVGFADERWEAYLHSVVLSKSQRSVSQRFRLKFPTLTAGLEFDLGNQYLFAEGTYAASEQATTTPLLKTSAPVRVSTYEAGVLDRSLANEDHLIFFGLSVKYDQYRENELDNTSLTLPALIGVEKALADWVTLRASLTQNLVLGYTRNEALSPPGNARDTVTNNTTVSGGLSFRAKGFELDGVLESTGTGALNSEQLLTRASLTYWF